MKKLLVRLMPLFAFGALSGCVAAWGASYNVVSANTDGIVIQYDSGLTSSAKVAALARNHCKQYGKVAEPEDAKMPGLLLGILEESYSCKSS